MVSLYVPPTPSTRNLATDPQSSPQLMAQLACYCCAAAGGTILHLPRFTMLYLPGFTVLYLPVIAMLYPPGFTMLQRGGVLGQHVDQDHALRSKTTPQAAFLKQFRRFRRIWALSGGTRRRFSTFYHSPPRPATLPQTNTPIPSRSLSWLDVILMLVVLCYTSLAS